MPVTRANREAIRKRANYQCEYCHLAEEIETFPAFHVEHIVASKHRSDDSMKNLALACMGCNLRKGPNLAGLLEGSDDLVRLFHPRRDVWTHHFFWAGPYLEGLTDIGRVTIEVLGINLPENVAIREGMLEDGVDL